MENRRKKDFLLIMEHPRIGSLAACALAACLVTSCATSPQADAPPAAPDVPSPPAIDFSDDEANEARIRNSLDNQPMDEADIEVTSYNGVVLLTGQVLSQAAKEEATGAAAFAGGDVRRIVNELAVVDDITEDDDAADQRLASRVESGLDDAGIDTEAVEVVADRGTVFLISTALSREQGQAAAQAASRTQGVDAVRTVFTYTD